MTKRIMLMGGFIWLLSSFVLVANSSKSPIDQDVMPIKDVARKVALTNMVTISGTVTGLLDDARYIVTDPTASILVYFHGAALDVITQNSIVDARILVTGEYVLDKKIRIIKVRKKEHVIIL